MKNRNMLWGLVILILIGSAMTVSSQDLQTITLPPAQKDIGKPLMQALNERKTIRHFSSRKLPLQELSNLLWAGFGINRDDGRRTAPSAVNWQEIDIYVALEKGVYRYNAQEHILEPFLAKDIRAATGRQEFCADAPVNLVFVSNFSRMGDRTPEEKMFYSATDTGFISQNVYLYCASQGLGTVVRGNVDKPALHKVMGLTSDQHIILCQTIGYPNWLQRMKLIIDEI